MPQIITQLGFTSSKTQLLTIPPYFCGGVAAWLVGHFSDRFAWRFPFIVGPCSGLVSALGLLFNFSSDVKNHVAAMYFSIVLAQIGIYPLLPGISAWAGNNLARSWKRSIGLAWLMAAGNLGSESPVPFSYLSYVLLTDSGWKVWLEPACSWTGKSPGYPTGYGTSLGIVCLAALVACIFEFWLWKLKKAKASQSEADIRSKYTQAELDAMGEKSPRYQYTLYF